MYILCSFFDYFDNLIIKILSQITISLRMGIPDMLVKNFC